MDCEYFSIDKGHQGKLCEVLLSPGELKVIIFLSGFGTIISTQMKPVEFKAGDCILIPADFEGTMCFADEAEYLTVKL